MTVAGGRGASPAATAYADITAWLEAAKQTPGKAGPLPAVAPELLAVPAVSAQWAWANIVSGRTTDPWEHLRLTEKAAKDSASFGLLAPELMLHAIRNGTAALYERARRVWSYNGAHLEEFDEASLRQQREACNNLMGRLLDLRSGQYLKTLKGDSLLDFKLAYAAGDFDAAGNTRAGQRSERFILHSTRAEMMAHEGLQAFYSGDASLARTKLVYALELEKVADPDYPGLGAFGGVADGEYVLMLRALVGYVDLRTAERKQGRVVMEFLTKAIALAKLPGHADSYRALEEEFKWRTTYVDDASAGRRAIAQYLSKLLFQNGPRNAVFERAHFLDSSLVDGLVHKRQGVALGWLQSEMINDLPLPPKWDGHRVINERYENPNYAINKRKYFDAIVSRDYQAALALDDTPRMIERHLEYNVAEPEFWGYYRALLRTLRWR